MNKDENSLYIELLSRASLLRYAIATLEEDKEKIDIGMLKCDLKMTQQRLKELKENNFSTYDDVENNKNITVCFVVTLVVAFITSCLTALIVSAGCV